MRTTSAAQHEVMPVKLSQPVQMSIQLLQTMCNNKYNYVSIRSGKWKELHLSNIIRYVVEWAIDNGLFLCKNQEADIIKMIEHVRFPNLKKLDVSGNLIVSVEAISRACFPSLEKLNLKDNNIASFSALRRISAPHLQSVDVCGNYAHDMGCLSQLQSKKLREIFLEDYDEVAYCHDCQPLAKLESSHLEVLWILSESRIQQHSFYEALQQRAGVDKTVASLCKPQELDAD